MLFIKYRMEFYLPITNKYMKSLFSMIKYKKQIKEMKVFIWI